MAVIATEDLLDLARSWIEDTSVLLVGELIDQEYLSDRQVRASVEKWFPGGWEGFAAIDGEYDSVPSESYKAKPLTRPPRVEFSTDHRGCSTTRCLDCGLALILFDDDEHFCEVTGTSTEFHTNDSYEDD
jgi:hypothetical protein